MSTAVIAKPLQSLDKALSALATIGISTPPTDNAPVLAVIERVKGLSEGDAVVIARTLQVQSHFAQVVRDEITATSLSDRHEAIAQMFNSIRDDGRKMLVRLEDGKFTFVDKIQNGWMNLTRGDIPTRFRKIQSLYGAVMKDSQGQIAREEVILTSYQDFRLAMKQAEIAAHEMFKKAQTALDEKQAAVQVAQLAVTNYAGDDAAEKARLEMERDQAIRAAQEEDDRYQKVKNLADNLQVSYAATEVVMARLNQTHQSKSKLYDQGITFFGTMESVLTAMGATLTSLQGLHESTQTVEAMKTGINQGLEDLATMGSEVQMRAIKTAHGPTIQAASVKKLVESIIDFQQKSAEVIREQRIASTKNAEEISTIVEEGRQRFAALIQQGNQ